MEDAGKYFVSASNIAGVSKAAVNITVEEEESSEAESSSEESSSEPESSSEASESEPEEKKPEPVLPTINVVNDAITVEAGTIVKLACKVAGKI